MALRIYKNSETGEIKRSLKVLEEPWVEQLTAPATKFMEKVDANNNKSRIKGLKKQLTERARNYSRDVEIDQNIQVNKVNGLDEQVTKSFLNSKGERRKKIDDL